MRFDVAFTFTRSSRDMVRALAELAAARHSRARTLFDEYHQEELSTPRGGLTLLDWYQRESRLVVVALSHDYDDLGSWTHFEWPQVLGLIRSSLRDQSVLLLRTDDHLPHDFAGLGDMAFALDTRTLSTTQLAAAIESRVERLVAAEAGRSGEPSGSPADSSVFLTDLDRTKSPDEVPAPPVSFAGRHSELAELQALASGPVRTIVISGPPGVGKSAMAAQLAMSMAEDYPHGRLYVDLLGGTPGVEPVSAMEAVSRLLRSLGTAGPDIPTSLEEAAARLRTLIANRRVLIVLDNAANQAQVRHLIPGNGPALALITSRAQLQDLDRARHLSLGRLSNADGLEQLGGWVDATRMAAEPDQAARLVEMCDHLPLAIRIIGARIAARPVWRLQTLVEALADERARLSELQLGELGVRSAFHLSYDSLERVGDRADPRGVLRGIGALGARVVGVEMIAELVDRPPAMARSALEQLADAQLLEVVDDRRYRIHDLVRLFASELASDAPWLEGPGGGQTPELDAGVGRVIAYLLHCASEASQVLQPVDPRRTVDATEPTESRSVEEFDEVTLHNLVAVLTRSQSDSSAHDGQAVRVPDAVFWFCHRRAYHEELRAVSVVALAAARRLGSREAESAALHNLSIALLRLRNGGAAREAAERAVRLRVELGDRYGEGRSRDALGRAMLLQGDAHGALDEERASLKIAQELEDAYSQSNVLCNMVPVYLALGSPAEAVAAGSLSVDLRRTLGDPYGRARMGMSLAAAFAAIGEFDSAAHEYEASAQIFSELDDYYDLARCLVRLAEVYTKVGEREQALNCLSRVAEARRAMGDTLGLDEAERMMSSLHGSPSEPSDDARS